MKVAMSHGSYLKQSAKLALLVSKWLSASASLELPATTDCKCTQKHFTVYQGTRPFIDSNLHEIVTDGDKEVPFLYSWSVQHSEPPT